MRCHVQSRQLNLKLDLFTLISSKIQVCSSTTYYAEYEHTWYEWEKKETSERPLHPPGKEEANSSFFFVLVLLLFYSVLPWWETAVEFDSLSCCCLLALCWLRNRAWWNVTSEERRSHGPLYSFAIDWLILPIREKRCVHLMHLSIYWVIVNLFALIRLNGQKGVILKEFRRVGFHPFTAARFFLETGLA